MQKLEYKPKDNDHVTVKTKPASDPDYKNVLFTFLKTRANFGALHYGKGFQPPLRSELSSDSDSAYDSASVASVASVNQP